jgi:hypothetical protein
MSREETMANVYVEARPKGRPHGSPIDDYVVEGHVDHELGTSKRSKKRSIGRKKAAITLLSLASDT